MSRLTITLNDDLHRALKETAARQGRTIASIIEESLRLRGIQDQSSARTLVAQARKRAQLDPDMWRDPNPGYPAPDPGDDHLWALLDTFKRIILVTGDHFLLQNPPARNPVITPKTCVECFLT